ncbi:MULTISPECIES: Rrf2 family transcriptional regulator [unclassified Herbaspirillum]|uniref:RrF2 family transcriptional regulator n=1 Tax=unclassified Herbaspirillum TaxID=2624150 RepID=UPI00114FCDCA|nr:MULTISPECIES: Rrf2 family transcriptional regulator [unclassified Herbaspirillum]MBB5390076.1 DNA-binding IscR family transcriptional regulator [Herbaspirillum sp. SJZ102]TQK09425.1 BadM/Rrf2 family transcriptional regulator [Herbaspirillum sp. SJZ130]TQK13888.1 BadM/Rrf2 family transcriptional regulator [Herbaspirillum sp. SJZ106]TWC69612.1 BadM/Rrf2 family transcriptional regulator [Herbaspirillum sp. SJZ099]
MRTDTRLSRMLHVLVHMHLLGGRETSETIALMLNTNPVVVRRTMACLKSHGIVQSEGGKGGGWILAKPAEHVSLLDVQNALSTENIFAIGPSSDHPQCPVEAAVNSAVGGALQQAHERFSEAMRGTTLADLASTIAQPR